MSAEFPVTNIGLANACLAMHNAAMTMGHSRSYNNAPATPMDIACILSAAFAGMAEQLANSNEAYPSTVVPVPATADQATAMELVGYHFLKTNAPERLRTDTVTVSRELLTDVVGVLSAYINDDRIGAIRDENYKLRNKLVDSLK